MIRQLHACDDCVSNLIEQVGERAWRVGNQDCVGVVVGRDFLQRVEVLRHQDELHHVLGRRTRHGFCEILDRIFQAGDDCFPLDGGRREGEPV